MLPSPATWLSAPVSIIAHSLGGNIALRYAGIYPDKVRKLVAIEGLGPAPKVLAERLPGITETAKTFAAKVVKWVENGWLNLVGGCCGTTPEHIRAIANHTGVNPRWTWRSRESCSPAATASNT